MKTEEFQIQNIKCQGCVQTIQEAFSKLDQELNVIVDLKNQKLKIESETILNRSLICKVLESIGFPEKSNTKK